MADKRWDGSSTAGDWGVAGNWVSSGVPGAGDNVRVGPDSTNAISGTLDQSGVALADVIFEEGYSQAVGTISAGTISYLQLDPDRFEWAATGTSYVDIGSAAIPVEVKNAKSNAGTGKRGLYLIGSGITTLSVVAGQVGVAFVHGSTATVATATVSGTKGDLICGAGTSLTTGTVKAGKLGVRCGATTLNCNGGTLTTEEEGAITTVNVRAGNAILNSTGTITLLELFGGHTDLNQNKTARTVTTLRVHKGASFDLGDHITLTNPIVWSDGDTRVTAS